VAAAKAETTNQPPWPSGGGQKTLRTGAKWLREVPSAAEVEKKINPGASKECVINRYDTMTKHSRTARDGTHMHWGGRAMQELA